jgi:hypothetical protein
MGNCPNQFINIIDPAPVKIVSMLLKVFSIINKAAAITHGGLSAYALATGL